VLLPRYRPPFSVESHYGHVLTSASYSRTFTLRWGAGWQQGFSVQVGRFADFHQPAFSSLLHEPGALIFGL